MSSVGVLAVLNGREASDRYMRQGGGGGAKPCRPHGIRALFSERRCHDFCLVRSPYQAASILLPPLECPRPEVSICHPISHVGLGSVQYLPGRPGGCCHWLRHSVPVTPLPSWKAASPHHFNHHFMAPGRVTRARSGYRRAEAVVQGWQGPILQQDAQLEGQCKFGLPDVSLWRTGLALCG